jgi:glycosyltransferase involved in cell wall biosynthesis
MKRIKILHITQSVGGVETYLKQIFSTIDHNKFEVVLVGTVSDLLEPYCIKYNVRFQRLKMSRGLNPILDIRSIFQLARIIKKEKPICVHLHSSKGGFLGRIATKLASHKSLFTPHGLSYLSFSGFKRMMFFFLELIGKKYTYKIHAVSFSEANKLVYELGHKRANIFVVQNAIIIKDAVSMIDKCKHKLTASLKVGTIARLTPQKNPLLFIEIANAVIKKTSGEAHFYFLGVGEHDHLKNEVEQKISEYDIAANVHLLQRGDLDTSIGFLQQLDVFLFPSVFEGLSYALLEAMLEGVPCVVSNVDGNNDLIHNNMNGYTCITVEEYVNAICALLFDKAQAKQIGEAGRNYILAKHDLSKNIKQLEAVYETFV